MTPPVDDQQEFPGAIDRVLVEAAVSLKELLAQVAACLIPFPAFMNMITLQAVELEPAFTELEDRGCVVVIPGGNICQLDLKMIPGAPGARETDQMEEFLELDLLPGEYILYATNAIGLLTRELLNRKTGLR